MPHIYIIKDNCDDEAHIFESEDTLAEVIDKESKDIPYLQRLFDPKFWVIENTSWDSDLMMAFRSKYEYKELPSELNKRTAWRGKYRLWQWYGTKRGMTRSGDDWICEHAKEIKLTEG